MHTPITHTPHTHRKSYLQAIQILGLWFCEIYVCKRTHYTGEIRRVWGERAEQRFLKEKDKNKPIHRFKLYKKKNTNLY